MVVTSMETKFVMGPKALTTKYPPLECVSCTYYQVQFEKNQAKTQALIDTGNWVNVITLLYLTKLSLKV